MYSPLPCPLAGRCGGCPWIGSDTALHPARRRDAILPAWNDAGLPTDLLADAPFYSLGDARLRDRTDLALRATPGGPVLGMWNLDHSEVLDIGDCPALSSPLLAWTRTIADAPPPLPLASLRLRVDPDGVRGIWIDAPNESIRDLLVERAWIQRHLDDGVLVELGQRRKPVVAEPERLRLAREPHLHPWFHTPLGDGRLAPILTPVGGFTQPSLAINRLLVTLVLGAADRIGTRRWLELGAGAGNFTLPLAARPGAEVRVVETDETALRGLRSSAEALGLADRIRDTGASMTRLDRHFREELAAAEAILADPPRSGLGLVIDGLRDLPDDRRPPHLLLVSCWADALVRDAAALRTLGYHPRSIEAVNQFTQSPHAEWIVHFHRDPA